MKIKTLIRFSDLKENTIREVGEEFEVTRQRAEELFLLSPNPIVEIIEEIENAKPKEKIEKAIKNKSRKK